jgi:ferredoxin
MARRKMVAVVRCGGGTALREGVSRDELPEGCDRILELHPEGINACRFGCLGGGSCVAACRKHAISIGEVGVARVDRSACVGCGLCAKACPQRLIALVPPENAIQPACSNEDAGPVARKECTGSCIGCGLCERACPAGAVHVVDGHAVIDQNACVACGMCAVTCPRGAIRDAAGIFAVRL